MLLGSKKKNKLCRKQCTNFANKETSCSTTKKKRKKYLHNKTKTTQIKKTHNKSK